MPTKRLGACAAVLVLALAKPAPGGGTPQPDAVPPAELFVRKAHVARFSYPVLSPDRSLLVTVDARGGVARVWNFPAGTLRAVLAVESPSSPVFGRTVAFLAGRRLLVGESARIRIVDLDGVGAARGIQLPGEPGAWRIQFVLGVAGGTRFVVGRNASDGTDAAELLLVAADTAAVVSRFPVEFAVEAATAFGDGLCAVFGRELNPQDLSRKAKIFRAEQLQLLKTFDGVGFFDSLRLLQGHETYHAISLAGDDGDAPDAYSLFDAKNDAETTEKLPVGEPVDGSFGAMFPDQGTLLTPSRRHVSLWDLPGRRVLQKIVVREPDGYTFTEALLDEAGGALHLGTARYSIPERAFAIPEGTVNAVDLDCAWVDADTTMNFGCGASTPAGLLEWVKAELGEVFTGVMPFLARSPSGRFLAETLPANFIVWDTISGKPVVKMELPVPGYLHDTAFFAPDESAVLLLPGTSTDWPRPRLALGTPDPQAMWPARLFSLSDGKETARFAAAGHSGSPELFQIAAFSPGGDLLALGSDGTVVLIDTTAGKQTLSLRSPVRALEFLDGRTLVIAGVDGGFSLLRLPGGALEPAVARSAFGAPVHLRRSTGGRFLTATSPDGVVEIWRIPSFEKVLTTVLLPGGNWVHFAPDGAYDASGDAGEFLGWRTTAGVRPFTDPAGHPRDPGLLGRLFGTGAAPQPQPAPEGGLE